ncbi:MAG: amidohydrolase family protein [Firmicutes bacterium]|nr:amidohydrolase family protein [Bacillota bacterium]
MKVDFHIHVTPDDLIRDYRSIYDKEPYWALLSESPINKFANGEAVIADLDSSGFDVGVVTGFSFRDLGLCRYVNDYTIELVRKYPGRIKGMMAISPKEKGFEAEFVRCIEAGLVGVGEMFLSGQGVDPFRRDDLAGLMGLAKEVDVPIVIHSNEPVGHDYVGKVEVTPKEICNIALDFPDNKLVFAHFGGGLPFYELMREIGSGLSNVFYDTAAGIYLYRPEVFRVLREIGILDKILFGSDFPLLSIVRYKSYFEKSGLNSDELDQILGENACRLLNL